MLIDLRARQKKEIIAVQLEQPSQRLALAFSRLGEQLFRVGALIHCVWSSYLPSPIFPRNCYTSPGLFFSAVQIRQFRVTVLVATRVQRAKVTRHVEQPP